MGMRDNARRNLRDWTTSDENIIGKPGERVGAFERSPEYKISKLSQALPKMTSEERAKNLQDLRTYIDYYHIVHQGEKQVPAEMNRAFREIAEKSNRLTLVENARLALELRGGPPTNRTIQESLERSAAQRAQMIEQYAVKPTLSQELSWRDLQPQQDRKQDQAQVQTQERTQTRATEMSSASAPSSAPQTRIEVAPSVAPQTVAEPVRQPVTVEAARQPVQQVIAEPMRVPVETVKSPQQTITEPTKSMPEMSKDGLGAKMDQLEKRVNELGERQATVRPEQFRQDTARAQPTVSLETYAALAEGIRHDRAQSHKLSAAIDGLSKEQIEKRIQQLEPVQAKLEAQEKAAHRAAGQAMAPRYDSAELRGITRELGYLDNALHFKQQGFLQEPSWKDLHPKQGQAQAQKQGKSQQHKHEQKQSRSRSRGMEISA